MADSKPTHHDFVFREGYVLKGKLNPNAKPPKGRSVFAVKPNVVRGEASATSKTTVARKG